MVCFLFLNTCVITLRRLISDWWSFGEFDRSPVANITSGAKRGTRKLQVRSSGGQTSPGTYCGIMCAVDPYILLLSFSNQMMIKIIRSPCLLIMFTFLWLLEPQMPCLGWTSGGLWPQTANTSRSHLVRIISWHWLTLHWTWVFTTTTLPQALVSVPEVFWSFNLSKAFQVLQRDRGHDQKKMSINHILKSILAADGPDKYYTVISKSIEWLYWSTDVLMLKNVCILLTWSMWKLLAVK